MQIRQNQTGPSRKLLRPKGPTPPPEGNPWTPTEIVATSVAATGAAVGLGYLGFEAGLGSGALLGLLLTRPGGQDRRRGRAGHRGPGRSQSGLSAGRRPQESRAYPTVEPTSPRRYFSRQRKEISTQRKPPSALAQGNYLARENFPEVFPNSGFVLGHFAGIQIRLHWTFLLAAGWFFQGGFTAVSLLLFGALFGSVFLHELGHCFAARSVGGRADLIVLWPLGGVAYTQANRGNVIHSVWISLAGPLVNLLIGAGCAAALWGQGYPFRGSDFSPLNFAESGALSEVGFSLFLIFKMQLVLFCLNVLIPAYPLDGGQALASLLSLVTPLNQCILIMTATTVGAAVFLWSQDEVFLAVYLALQVPALLGPASDFHPLAHFYNRPGVIEGRSPVFVAQGLELLPCPKCQEKLHPESELCPNCGQRYPFRN